MFTLSFHNYWLRLFALVVLGGLIAGCSKGGPPPPLPLDRIPVELRKAFADAPQAQKELVERAVAVLEQKEHIKALMVVQGLCAVPELTEKQRQVAVAALLSLNQELQAAQQRGDKDAAQFLEMRQKVK